MFSLYIIPNVCWSIKSHVCLRSQRTMSSRQWTHLCMSLNKSGPQHTDRVTSLRCQRDFQMPACRTALQSVSGAIAGQEVMGGSTYLCFQLPGSRVLKFLARMYTSGADGQGRKEGHCYTEGPRQTCKQHGQYIRRVHFHKIQSGCAEALAVSKS